MVKDPLRRRDGRGTDAPRDVRTHEAVVGDDAVHRATGRRRADWFTLLDEQGAAGGDHAGIVARLTDHGVEPWWAQSVAVGYEQARGLRRPGQRADGSLEAAVSRTLPVAPDIAFAWLADLALRSRWLEVEPEVRGTTPGRSVRWAWPDGGRVTARLTGLPDGRTRVAVQHRVPVQHSVRAVDGEADPDRLAELKRCWADRLDALQRLAARG